MKTAAILSSLALALPAFAAPAATSTASASAIRTSLPCPSANGKVLTSNNNAGYKVTCKADSDGKVLREVDTTYGIQTCLTACDGTVGCEAITFVPSNAAQTEGQCYMKGAGKKHKANHGVTYAVKVSGPGYPSYTATSSTAAATSSAASAPTGSYGGVAIRSGSDIQYSAVNANGTDFWLNKGSATYCPSGITCSNTTSTLFLGGSSGLSLDTEVPGGQQVYVDNTGALKFTVAHSANTGTGSNTTGFSVDASGSHLQFGGSDFLACPQEGAYRVYASAATKDVAADCLGFEFRISEFEAEAAWEYV